jgi:hypothetical protein
MFQVTFETENAAFEDDSKSDECARILEVIAKHLKQGYRDGAVYDFNGNRVGKWSLS